MSRKTCFAVLALSLAAFASLTGVRSALAQAGSTGGTVGKTDKSLSGGEDARPTSQPNSQAHVRQPTTKEQRTGGSCGKIVGTWAWHYLLGTSETVFRSDGTASNSGGITNTWTCAGSIIVATWSHGFVDRIKVSPDGSSLSITNNIGQSFSATRK
jgi:hypothetical protein